MARCKIKFPKGVSTAQRPKMRNHAGRTWDVCDVKMPDGSVIQGNLDTTWSMYFYFFVESENRWFKAEIGRFERGRQDSCGLIMDLSQPGFES